MEGALRAVLILAFYVCPSMQATMEPNETELMADQGNWTVEDCILVRVAGQIVLQPDPDNANATVTMELPVGAKASGTCKVVPDPKKYDPTPKQRITLNWNVNDKKGAVLWRNITMEFSRNYQKYGVSKISAVYEVKQFEVVKNETDPVTNETTSTNVTVTSFISMTTFKMEPWEFLVPVNRSYLCTDAGSKPMHTELHRSDEHPGDRGVKLTDAVLSAKKVQLDAFRVGAPEGEFQISVRGSSLKYAHTDRPNDVVHQAERKDRPLTVLDIVGTITRKDQEEEEEELGSDYGTLRTDDFDYTTLSPK